jgi:hypothetical protein
MIDQEVQRTLNRVLALERYSLASYLLYAPPWACSGSGSLLKAVGRIAADQQAEAGRLGRFLVRRYGYAELGQFPTQFTGYNDLAPDYLQQRLIEQQRLMIAELARCAEQLAGDPDAKRLAEEALAGEKLHLDLLTRPAHLGAPPIAIADPDRS